MHSKFNTVIFFLGLSLLVPVSAAAETAQLDRYGNAISRLLNSIHSIIEKQQSTDEVSAVYYTTQAYIKNGNLIFRIDEKVPGILSGAYFGFNLDNNEAYLTFGTQFLDTFNEKSSVHHSILMHELKHLHDFLVHRDLFIKTPSDIKEHYWFDLDAYHIEAKFILNYMQTDFNISEFERDLVRSFEEDNLQTISLILKKESMDIFFYLNRIEDEYRQGKHSRDSMLQQLITKAKALLDTYNNLGYSKNFASYENYLNLATYNRFLFRLLPLVINSPDMTWGTFFNIYPEYEYFHSSVINLMEKYGQEYHDYAAIIIC